MKFFNNLLNKTTTTVATPEVKKEAVKPLLTVTPGDWFTSKEHYLEFKAAFKAYANDKNTRYALSSVQLMVYAILRNREWKKGWTYPTKVGKQVEHNAKLASAFSMIKAPYFEEHILKPFDGTVTTEMLMALRENLEQYRDD